MKSGIKVELVRDLAGRNLIYICIRRSNNELYFVDYLKPSTAFELAVKILDVLPLPKEIEAAKVYMHSMLDNAAMVKNIIGKAQ